MRSRDLPKLRSFIQEWVDEYYNSRRNKVPKIMSILGKTKKAKRRDLSFICCLQLFLVNYIQV